MRAILFAVRSIDFGPKGAKPYSNPRYPLSFFSMAASPNKRLQRSAPGRAPV